MAYKHKSSEQPELVSEERAEYKITPQEQAQKEEYRRRFVEALKDPKLRAVEGFPIGTDEAILALSDPPYYTACPNPFLNEIIEKWRDERAALRQDLGLQDDEPAGSKRRIREDAPLKTYHREPFAADVSEGKSDPIYNAHSYHTKVPHKAIMRYILHYTDPGDVVLDGFCGTGMTGVAAQLCGDKKTVESLGYTIKDEMVLDEENKPISKLGARKAVLIDLSPAATFIAYNYNTPVNARAFERESRRILKEVEEECGWMYETTHTDEKTIGRINYMLWSDVFLCPQCGGEVIFWNAAIDKEKGEIRDAWNCPQCATLLAKTPAKGGGALKAERTWETIFDRSLGETIRRIKQVPVIINYTVAKKRYNKIPDGTDFQLIRKIEESNVLDFFPNGHLPNGEKTNPLLSQGITHIHHFYTVRNLLASAILWSKIQKSTLYLELAYAFSASLRAFTKLSSIKFNYYFHGGGGAITPGMKGTYVFFSIIPEIPVTKSFASRIPAMVKAYNAYYATKDLVAISSQSSSRNALPENSIDYVFIDPPFGSNIMYSELNYIWESWLKVTTNPTTEAIINKIQHKKLPEYQGLMEKCFSGFFQVLKPGRWMTIEFHNSHNAVWNSIHEAITRAGLVVADVRTLDKKQGAFNQVNAAGAVKQDLVISAYKPTSEFEQRFFSEAGTALGAWDFLRQHLEQLPLPNLKDGVIEPLQERMPYLLYDRMVAFHIQRGLTVPLSAPDFYQGLSQRFLEREGMVFTPAQAAAYDKLRLQAERVEQLALFVTDESSARQWLRQELEHEPATYGDIMPKFMQALHQAKYEALPELKIILEQSFIKDAQDRWCVPDLDNAAHLEQLRQTALLREFNEYRKSKGRLKVFRSEAVRSGFSNAWREREYDIIVQIAERLPETVLQEDQQLLMYYHNASLRQSGQPKQEALL
ncbi:MAG: DNA methyltransferase [Chloroflexota bacterium]